MIFDIFICTAIATNLAYCIFYVITYRLSHFIPAFLVLPYFSGRETVKAYGLSCCNHYLCHVKRAFLLFYLLWGLTRILAAFPPRGSPSPPHAIRSARRPMGPAAPYHAVVVRPSAVVRGHCGSLIISSIRQTLVFFIDRYTTCTNTGVVTMHIV